MKFKKSQEYAVTGFSMNQEIGLELVTVTDLTKSNNLVIIYKI